MFGSHWFGPVKTLVKEKITTGTVKLPGLRLSTKTRHCHYSQKKKTFFLCDRQWQHLKRLSFINCFLVFTATIDNASDSTAKTKRGLSPFELSKIFFLLRSIASHLARFSDRCEWILTFCFPRRHDGIGSIAQTRGQFTSKQALAQSVLRWQRQMVVECVYQTRCK